MWATKNCDLFEGVGSPRVETDERVCGSTRVVIGRRACGPPRVVTDGRGWASKSSD